MLTALTPWILVGGAAAGGQPGGTYVEEFGDGFEDGTGAAWSRIFNSPQFNTDLPRTGSYAFNIDTDIGNNPYCRINFTDQAEIYGRNYFRIDSTDMTDGNNLQLVTILNAFGFRAKINIGSSSGVLRLTADTSGLVGGAGGEISLGTWHRLEYRYVDETSEGAADGIMQVRLDGATVIDIQNHKAGAGGTVNRVHFGSFQRIGTYNIELHLDDFSVGTGGWPGGDGGG